MTRDEARRIPANIPKPPSAFKRRHVGLRAQLFVAFRPCPAQRIAIRMCDARQLFPMARHRPIAGEVSFEGGLTSQSAGRAVRGRRFPRFARTLIFARIAGIGEAIAYWTLFARLLTDKASLRKTGLTFLRATIRQ